MHRSRWCHSFVRGGVTALVHALTLEVVYLSNDLANMLLVHQSGELDADADRAYGLLITKGFFVENSEADDRMLSHVRQELKSSISLELLYLLVTDGCNLRCTYCFEDSPATTGKFRATQMTSETAMRSLDLFAEMSSKHGNPQKKKVIHLYGGEPLANRSIVHQAARHANELKRRHLLPETCQTTIVTNGVLLNEDDARQFAEQGVTVGLSIDGPAMITDRYRLSKRANIRVTERVTEAFQLLKKHGVSVGLSVTLTPDAVANPDSFLEFFTQGLFRQADGVSMNLLHFTPNLELSDTYYHDAVELQIKAFQLFRGLGIYEDRMMRKARAFVGQEPMYADCGVVGHQLVIAPDGRIGVCQDFVKPRTYFSRSVYDSDHHDLMDVLFAEWRDRTPLAMAQCADCVALAICGGGCPASAEVKSGDRNNLDDRACHQSKRALEWLVWDAYEQLG